MSRIAGLIAIAFTGLIAAGALDYGSFRRLAVVTAALFVAGDLVAALGIRNPAHRAESVAPQAMAQCRGRITAPPVGPLTR
ncbi:hypothetical protein [Mycolicibacterium hodleri]|uniref:Uncharacterized protein n=1 Tax=Mycolicibacterium hodleri TaxID=49897 RepID=A0A502E995_9MYCO|nr:hypothetical protein [Mycolicibacterium hodleri]TPG33569.1 hypothetical protein EAH80_14910 [Mycolicibacterium hodleri]